MRNLNSVDYLRAFSMLYIVGFWHLFDYSTVSFGHHQPYTKIMTLIVLALFVFISGYMMGGKKNQQMSARQFYQRRLLRVYPLYALALAIFYFSGINDGWRTVKGLMGISMYWEPAPLTLWFVSMLVLFYLMTPLLLALVTRAAVFGGVIIAIFIVTLLWEVTVGTVDLRVLMYLPSFCLGIFCANFGLENQYLSGRRALILLPVAAGLAFIPIPLDTLDYLKVMPLITLCAYLVFYVCYANEEHFAPLKPIALLSYASFAMYLFHRPIYNLLRELYFPEQPAAQTLYLMTVGLLTVAITAWAAQKSYDRLSSTLRTQAGTPALKSG